MCSGGTGPNSSNRGPMLVSIEAPRAHDRDEGATRTDRDPRTDDRRPHGFRETIARIAVELLRLRLGVPGTPGRCAGRVVRGRNRDAAA
jgi:hypothetical protein